MNTSRRILIGTLAFLIIGAGLVTGIYFSGKERSPQNSDTASVQEKAEPNFNTYEISPTSRGEILIMTDVALTIEGAEAHALLSKEDAAAVKTGQTVLPLNAESNVLAMLGAVTAVSLDAKDMAHITIKFDEDGAAPATLPSKGKIVTGNIPDAQRLPLSALVEKNGVPYLWEAALNEDGTHSVYFKPADIMRKTGSYFVINENSQSTNVFVLNPDKALRDGQTVNVKEVLYSGPELTEEGRAALLTKQRHDTRRKKTYSISRPQTPPGMANTGSCNPNSQILNDFIAKIEKLSKAPKRPNAKD